MNMLCSLRIPLRVIFRLCLRIHSRSTRKAPQRHRVSLLTSTVVYKECLRPLVGSCKAWEELRHH